MQCSTRAARLTFALTVSLHGIVFAAEHRNVLLLVSDNQSWPDCACYGNADVRTPGIDRLAASGMRFNHAFATTASCGPSRAVIYTGLQTPANAQYGRGHGVHTYRLNPKTETVYMRLADQGYHAALVGKQQVYLADSWLFSEDTDGNCSTSTFSSCSS